MARILTLTANLLAETTYTFATWVEGATQRATAETFQVGGKGINVTRLLARLGADSLALCFPGGATGERCTAWLRRQGVPVEPFVTPQETRTGAVVRAPGREETTFLGTENVIDPRAILACARFLDAQPADTVLAVGGSIPNWDGPAWEPLRAALGAWAARGALAVDTYGPPLAALAALPAALVKINRREFSGLAGVSASELTDERMPAALDAVARARPVRRWIVTDGPRAVWHCEAGATPRSLTPPTVREVSPTGSGDVLHAGVLFAIFVRGASLEEALQFALPLASANAAHPGVAEFDLTPFSFED